MIDSIYQTVQSLMNKDQLGYLKPMSFNLFAANAQRKEYNSYFIDLKVNVRKQNWMLDGRNFANLAEHTRQLIEHFSKELPIIGTGVTGSFYTFDLPADLEWIEDAYLSNGTTPIEKISYTDFKLLQRNIYAAPSECSPIMTKIGALLKVAPRDTTFITLHYLRKPLIPKWTFQEVAGKPYFDSTAVDFQDFDLPEASYDNLVNYIAEQAGVSIRDNTIIQTSNQEQVQDAQLDNKQ